MDGRVGGAGLRDVRARGCGGGSGLGTGGVVDHANHQWSVVRSGRFHLRRLVLPVPLLSWLDSACVGPSLPCFTLSPNLSVFSHAWFPTLVLTMLHCGVPGRTLSRIPIVLEISCVSPLTQQRDPALSPDDHQAVRLDHDASDAGESKSMREPQPP